MLNVEVKEETAGDLQGVAFTELSVLSTPRLLLL